MLQIVPNLTTFKDTLMEDIRDLNGAVTPVEANVARQSIVIVEGVLKKLGVVKTPTYPQKLAMTFMSEKSKNFDLMNKAIVLGALVLVHSIVKFDNEAIDEKLGIMKATLFHDLLDAGITQSGIVEHVLSIFPDLTKASKEIATTIEA